VAGLKHQAVWEKVALQLEDKPGDTIVKRGQDIPDGVDKFTLGVLTSVGAIRVVDTETSTDPEHPPQGPREAPSEDAPKAEWVEYATSRGMTEQEANRLSKGALIQKVS
jgi:hypothetical protein